MYQICFQFQILFQILCFSAAVALSLKSHQFKSFLEWEWMYINCYNSPLAYLTASNSSSFQCILNNYFGNCFPRVTFLMKNLKILATLLTKVEAQTRPQDLPQPALTPAMLVSHLSSPTLDSMQLRLRISGGRVREVVAWMNLTLRFENLLV